MVTIREARPDDVNRLHELVEELEGHKIDVLDFCETFEHNMNDPDIYYYIADDGGYPVGFVSLHVSRLLHHAGNIGEVQELVVTEGVRGTGIGARLFQKAKQTAKERGCGQLEVCCNRRREKAHGFYEAQGQTRSHFKFTCTLKGTGEPT